jgi:hypothetical protein
VKPLAVPEGYTALKWPHFQKGLKMSLSSQVGSALRIDELEPCAAPGLGPRILISIPSGFQLRQFVHSGVLDLLLERGFQVLIVSPNREGEGFAAQLPKQSVEVHALDLKSGRLGLRYWAARQHLFLKGPPTETLRHKMIDLQRCYPWVALAAQAGNHLLHLFPRLRRGVLRWEHLILRDKALEALLSIEPVDLILLGSPGYMVQDGLLLHAAVRRGIPVAAAVLSWDNLSSKGQINPQPDRLLVWSEHMRREAIQQQEMPAERIVVTGAPHYDIFANSSRFGQRSENLYSLGLDPARRLILYGTNHAGHFPDEIEVVRRVAHWVQEESLGTPCQLWVRLHPQAVAGPYKVQTDQYRELASKGVKVEFPPVQDSNLLWDLPQSDLEHLVRLLRDADVVINTASTLTIDAAIFDRPVICVAYDPAGDLPYDKSVRRYYDYTHMSNVVRARAVQLATSSDDLRQKIIAYLDRTSLDREGRKCIVAQQFGRIDGLSAARLVDQVVAIILARTAK